MEAFLYCWTDHKTDMVYVGYHKGHIDDGYICSSKSMLSEYKLRPNDFTRQIIAKGSVSDIISLETSILKASNAASNHSFYNKHNNNGIFNIGGHTNETKIKMSNSAIGRTRSIESRTKQSISMMGDGNHFHGKHHTTETKAKMSVSKKGTKYRCIKIEYNGKTYSSQEELRCELNCSHWKICEMKKRGIIKVL